MIGHNFLRVREMYLINALNEIPSFTLGYNKQRNEKTIRSYKTRNGKRLKKEHFLNSLKGQEMYKNFIERVKLKELLNHTRIELNTNALLDSNCINRTSPNNQISFFPSSYFKQAISRAKPEDLKLPSEYKYEFNGIRMRSRSEVVVAQVITSLNINFVYEPQLIVGDKVFTPDFLIHVPELNCCILLEYLGMMNSPQYVENIIHKQIEYAKSGFKPDVDIIYLMGSEKTLPDPKIIRNRIELVLDYITEVVYC